MLNKAELSLAHNKGVIAERKRILKLLDRLENESCTIESIGVPLVRSQELRKLIGDVSQEKSE